jgi:hypothetical protein
MLLVVLSLLLSQMAFLEILPYEGSTMTLLIIAAIAVAALAFFRLLIPLLIAAIFGGIPVLSSLLPT